MQDAAEIELRAAPGWRRLLAGLIDGGLFAGVGFAARRMHGEAGAAAARLSKGPVGGLLGPSALLERIGSPGERAMGVRTVDRRTGEPMELWRAMLLTASSLGVKELRRQLTPTPRAPSEEDQAAERERRRELEEIRRRHADDPDALNYETMRLYERHHPPPVRINMSRALLFGVGVPFVLRRVQRRLASTEVVLARPRGPQSP